MIFNYESLFCLIDDFRDLLDYMNIEMHEFSGIYEILMRDDEEISDDRLIIISEIISMDYREDDRQINSSIINLIK